MILLSYLFFFEENKKIGKFLAFKIPNIEKVYYERDINC